MNKKQYYAIWQGRRTGIFSTWKECKALTDGCPNGFKRFSNFDEANKKLKEELARIESENKRKQQILHEGISVSVNWIQLFEEVEWQIVNTKTYEKIERSEIFKEGTKDIAEFIAIVHALEHCKKNGLNLPVYTGNNTAIEWVKKPSAIPVRLMPTNSTKLSVALNLAVRWLKENEFSNQLMKWDTGNWGVNPASFGTT
jgi:ribonuclease HI